MGKSAFFGRAAAAVAEFVFPGRKAAERFRYSTGAFGMMIRRRAYSRILKSFGKGSYIKDGAVVEFPEKIEIGDDVSVNQFCVLHGMGGIKIGNGVRIAYGAKIFSFSHRFGDPKTPIHRQGYDTSPVEIGDDVWIGSNSVVLAGVKIGKGSVIGAGSVVKNDIPPFSVAVGSPAKAVRKRK